MISGGRPRSLRRPRDRSDAAPRDAGEVDDPAHLAPCPGLSAVEDQHGRILGPAPLPQRPTRQSGAHLGALAGRRQTLFVGAEIGRAVTNFDGPIVFVVVSRYHGGAFVVFSKALNESMEIAAVEGSYASVIGGAPAAATVFAREVKQRTEKDPRIRAARDAMAAASGTDAARLRTMLARATEQVRSEKLGEVADEFDGIHTIERALRVGSVDRIIAAADIRPYVIDALERGIARHV